MFFSDETHGWWVNASREKPDIYTFDQIISWHVDLDTTYMSEDERQREQDKGLLEFLFSDEGQSLFAKGYVRPIKADAMDEETRSYFLPDEDYARSVDVDWQHMSEVQASFNTQWTEKVAK